MKEERGGEGSKRSEGWKGVSKYFGEKRGRLKQREKEEDGEEVNGRGESRGSKGERRQKVVVQYVKEREYGERGKG